MVKTGSDRSNKFSVKHDPKVIMLRIKAMQEQMKKLFKNSAYSFQIVDERLNALRDLLNLEYGQFGEMSDLMKDALNHYGEWSDEDFEALHQKLLTKGFSEDEWALIIEWLDYTDYLLRKRYEICHTPTSRLTCTVQAQLSKDAEASEG